ncbi:hypothetical protein DRO69_09210, partial [Candidatus Bathyarchaeota archaeon]
MPVFKSLKIREENIVDPLKVFLYDPETGRKVLISNTRVLPTMDVDFLMRRGELAGFTTLRAEWHGLINGTTYNLPDENFYYPPDLSFEPSWAYGTVPAGSAINITKVYMVAEDYGAGVVVEWGTVPGTLDKHVKLPVAADGVVSVEFPMMFREGTYYRIGFYATKRNQTPTV